MNRNSVFIILFFFLFYSCESTETRNNSPAYFNLTAYFEKQATDLSAEKYMLNKFVEKDTELEEKQFQSINWKEELKSLVECDINKPAWKNSYTAVVVSDEGTSCIRYAAKDSSLKVKNINICFERDSVALINIVKVTRNFFYLYTQTLNYFPMKGYTITTIQKIRYSNPTTIEIKTLFNN